MNSICEAQRLGQSIWLDYVRRGPIRSGEFQRFIDQGISGVTSNPTIFEKAINESTDYDEALIGLARMGKTINEIYESLVLEDISAVADLFYPVYEKTGGAQGYVSLEVNPALAYDTDETVREAGRLFALLGRPNVLIKVPATAEGIPAIRRLISEGINVNATLIFSLGRYQKVREAYVEGLEALTHDGGDLGKVASVASFFVSRVDTAVDALLEEKVKKGNGDLKALLGKAAVANARLGYEAFKETFRSERFAALQRAGARLQYPVWASTGTKNPVYSDVLYVETLIGQDTVNTIPPATLDAFLQHGRISATIEQDIPQARQTMTLLEKAGINMEAVTDRLLAEGVDAFKASFDKLLSGVETKLQKLFV
ncbi:MAG: transaldolase [Chloroflexi bacterium]|nr:transaldolase [Chloroflexota bacterium]